MTWTRPGNDSIGTSDFVWSGTAIKSEPTPLRRTEVEHSPQCRLCAHCSIRPSDTTLAGAPIGVASTATMRSAGLVRERDIEVGVGLSLQLRVGVRDDRAQVTEVFDQVSRRERQFRLPARRRRTRRQRHGASFEVRRVYGVEELLHPDDDLVGAE
jgi:hypothetical protein